MFKILSCCFLFKYRKAAAYTFQRTSYFSTLSSSLGFQLNSSFDLRRPVLGLSMYLDFYGMGCGLSRKKINITEKVDTSMDHYLYAFDFDHTILDGSSNSAITDLLKRPIPQEILNRFDGTNWTEFSDLVMQHISSVGVSPQQIYHKIQELPLLPGMEVLLQRIRLARDTNIGSQLIVVSDANDFFIEAALGSLKPPIQPDRIISNYAVIPKSSVDDPTKSYLQIKPFENQKTCPFCPVNLCKGSALDKHIEMEGPFRKVYYAGDGSNDICPAMRLSEKDTLFVREGFALDAIIKAGETRKGIPIIIRAKIIYFTDAKTLLKSMEF